MFVLLHIPKGSTNQHWQSHFRDCGKFWWIAWLCGAKSSAKSFVHNGRIYVHCWTKAYAWQHYWGHAWQDESFWVLPIITEGLLRCLVAGKVTGTAQGWMFSCHYVFLCGCGCVSSVFEGTGTRTNTQAVRLWGCDCDLIHECNLNLIRTCNPHMLHTTYLYLPLKLPNCQSPRINKTTQNLAPAFHLQNAECVAWVRTSYTSPTTAIVCMTASSRALNLQPCSSPGREDIWWCAGGRA